MSIDAEKQKNQVLSPLVLIGPTASGKSSLALALSDHFDVELVSADAKAVYRGMDIGTAKPSPEDRRKVRYHLLDVVDPHESYTVSAFQSRAQEAISQIESAGRSVIVVGGSGLYIRSIVDDISIPPQFPEVRKKLEMQENAQMLWDELAQLDPLAASRMEPTNRSRILRALEVSKGSGTPFSSFGPGLEAYPSTRFCQVGLELDRAEMDRRIDERYDQQLEAGFLEEVKQLSAHELSRTAAQSLGYRELLAHLRGELTLEEAIALAKKKTKKFARRQQRWFRRDPRITWFDAMAPDLSEQVYSFWLASSK